MLKTERILDVVQAVVYSDVKSFVETVSKIVKVVSKSKGVFIIFDGRDTYNLTIKRDEFGYRLSGYERQEKLKL